MRTAIISDIHANETALRHVLADAAACGAERIVCLGDIVGYGPLPRETLACVRASAAIVLAGNHDDAVCGRQRADGFIDLAGEAVNRHRDALDADSLAWLKKLPYTGTFDGAVAAHGDFTDPARFNYVENEEDAAANFAATDAQLLFVGHSHVPGIFLTGRSGTVYRLAPQDFVLEDGKRYLVNPGSVGYPREEGGVCRSSYVLYDTDTRTVSFHFIPFSVASVMQRGVVSKAKRRAAWVVLAAALLAASALGVLAFREKPAKTKVVEIDSAAADLAARKLAERSITLARSHRHVRANLKLDRAGDPVELHLAFRAATGQTVGHPLTETVKGSSQKRFRIPAGATSARFTLFKPTSNSQPKVLQFSPQAE